VRLFFVLEGQQMSGLYDNARELFLKGDISYDTDDIRVKLVATAYTPNASTHTTVSDLGANVVATSGALASKTTTAGVADAADITFTAVTGAECSYLVAYQHVAGDSTDKLIAYIDQTSDSSLPVTPNGGDINVTWDSGANKIFKL
jgi:hypothetical protein